MNPLGIGIIGCGEVAAVHARCIEQIGGARIIGCCDTDPARAEQYRATWQAEFATRDARKIFSDPRIEAVYVCTHHDSHKPLALAAIDAGKAIFMEKPLALHVRECEEICTAVEKSGVFFFTGFKMRFYPMIARAQIFIPNPKMIAAQMMDTRWPDAFWANDPRKGGGNVLSEGVHTFDLLCHLANARPVRIYAEGNNFHHEGIDICDGLVATIAFDNGAIASVTQGDLGHPGLVSKLSFQMFEGAKTVHLYNRLKSGNFYDGEQSQTLDDPEELGYLEENRAFLTCLQNGEPSPCDHIAGWRATMMVQKAFESVASGAPVDLAGMW